MREAEQRSAHDNRFDRQMRLWGGHGQQRLETARICCLGSGPTASETLKNLVLPNVGEFVIVDDAKVSQADLGNNWFVEEERLNQPRAEVVKDLLVEMNADVKGHAIIKNPVDLVKTDPDFFKSFTCVIAACLAPDALRPLAKICHQAQIPLIVVRSFGLMGYARLQAPELTIQESHFDNDRMDLYMNYDQLNHFTELKEFVNSFQLDDIKDSMEHSHVPYIVILGQAIQNWVKEHGKPPSTFDEQTAFKNKISSMWRNPAEENFQEAKRFAYRAYRPFEFEMFTKRVLADAKAQNIDKTSSKFWVMVAALNRFIANEGHGFAPCVTSVPDMVSLTEQYVKIKDIFKARAALDVAYVLAHAQAIEKEAGLSPSVTEADIDFFNKSCRGLQVVRTRTLEEEYNPATFESEEANEILEEWQDPPEEGEHDIPRTLQWYFALRAVDQFYLKNSRFPSKAADLPQVLAETRQIISANKIRSEAEKDVVAEMVRYEGTEIHNIAAVMGGIGSQICLKVILGQYVPLNNTYIFDGVHGVAKAFAA